MGGMSILDRLPLTSEIKGVGDAPIYLFAGLYQL